MISPPVYPLTSLRMFQGTNDIDECVKGTIKNKKKQVADSLFGTMTPHQMDLIRDCWEHIELLEKSIASLEVKINDHMEPCSGMGNRSLQKHRTIYKVLEDCI